MAYGELDHNRGYTFQVMILHSVGMRLMWNFGRRCKMNDRCYYSRLYAICLTMACFSLAISCKSLPRAVGSDVADRIKITRDRLQTEIAATHSHPPLQELWNQAYISFDKANREGFRRPVCAGACVEVRGFASADNGTIRPCANGTFPLTNVCYSGTFGLGLNYQFDRNGSNFVARIGTSTNGLACGI